MRQLAQKVLAWLHRELVPPDPFESVAHLDAYFAALPDGDRRGLLGTPYEEARKLWSN